MTEDQIANALTKYDAQLQKDGIFRERFSSLERFPTRPEALAHARWMCQEALTFTEHKDKAMRWLCFIQGVLWMTGLASIDGLRDDNR